MSVDFETKEHYHIQDLLEYSVQKMDVLGIKSRHMKVSARTLSKKSMKSVKQLINRMMN